MPHRSHFHFKEAKELANSDFKRRSLAKKVSESYFWTMRPPPVPAHPSGGVGALLPLPPQDHGLHLLLLFWILAALFPVSLHHVQIQNSTFSVVPAKISGRWRLWFFSLFLTEDVLRHRGGDHITKNATSTISWGPRAVPQVTPLFKPTTPSVHEALDGQSPALAAACRRTRPTRPSISLAFSHLLP